MARHVLSIPRAFGVGAALLLACGGKAQLAPHETTGTAGASGSGGASGTGGVPATGGLLATGGAAVVPGVECLVASVFLAAPEPVTIEVLLPLSESLSKPVSDTDDRSRWEAVHEALMDPDQGLVAAFQRQHVGFTTFAQVPDGGDVVRSCTTSVQRVEPDVASYARLSAVYSATLPATVGAAPLADGIESAHARVDRADPPPPGPVVFLVVTDDEITSCSEAASADDVRGALLSRVEALGAAGIPVFVLRAGGDELELLLALANVGQGFPETDPMKRYYDLFEVEALKAMFTPILQGSFACAFEIDGEVAPENARFGRVTLDGHALEFDDPDGWRLLPPDRVELVGAACEALRDGEAHAIDVTFPCSVIQP